MQVFLGQFKVCKEYSQSMSDNVNIIARYQRFISNDASKLLDTTQSDQVPVDGRDQS